MGGLPDVWEISQNIVEKVISPIGYFGRQKLYRKEVANESVFSS